MPRLTVVVPTRDEPCEAWQASNITLGTLERQTFRDFSLIVVWDQFRKGASWARNEGFARSAKTELVLFSDDDVDWRPGALESLVSALDAHPEASYAYGAYRSNWTDPARIHTVGAREFDARLLRSRNFISTMSAIRAADFPGFDQSLGRYQDWDLWLTLLERGKTGVYCGEVIFETRLAPDGISLGGGLPPAAARAAVRRKHGLR